MELFIEGAYQGWLQQKLMSEPSFGKIWYFYLPRCICSPGIILTVMSQKFVSLSVLQRKARSLHCKYFSVKMKGFGHTLQGCRYRGAMGEIAPIDFENCPVAPINIPAKNFDNFSMKTGLKSKLAPIY